MGKGVKSKDFIEQLFTQEKEYIRLDNNEIKTNRDRVDIKHIACGHKWNVSVEGLKKGNRCPKCARTKRRFTHEFVSRYLEERGYRLLSEYKRMTERILVRHEICGNEYMMDFTRFKCDGKGCRMCNESKGEREIKVILNKFGIVFEPQKWFNNCRLELPLPFDFYIPSLNMCIEYNGIQHYKPVSIFGGEEAFEKQVIRDSIKKKYCQDNGINLIIIKYDENIEEILEKVLTKG